MAITTPPFRTSLLTANGAPFATDNGEIQTTRDWWLYWNQLTDRSNSNSKLATAGTHGDRPMPESMPDGALYYENDRGVLYANTRGVWQYVAGTMYGTLSPVDERPTDLGTHDAGFDFRTSVDPPREFLWSQTAWVEVTAVVMDNGRATLVSNSNPYVLALKYNSAAAQVMLLGCDASNTLVISNNAGSGFFAVQQDGTIRMFLGGTAKTLSVDANGFVKAT